MSAQVYLINNVTFQDYEDLSVNIKPQRLAVFVKKAQDLDLKPFLGAAFWYDFIKWVSNSGIAGIKLIDSDPIAAQGEFAGERPPDGPYNAININTQGRPGMNGQITGVVISGGVITNQGTVLAEGYGFQLNEFFDVNFGAYTECGGWEIIALDPTLLLDPNIPIAYKNLLLGCTYTDRAGNEMVYDGLIPALVYWTFARFIEADAVHYTSTGPVLKYHDAGTAVTPSDIAKLVNQQRGVANAHANNIEFFLSNNRDKYPLWRFNEKNKNSRQQGPRLRGIDKTAYNAPGIGGGYYPNGYGWDGFNNI